MGSASIAASFPGAAHAPFDLGKTLNIRNGLYWFKANLGRKAEDYRG